MARQPRERSLPRAFYVRPTVDVARDLLGKVLVHETAEGVAAGRIVEVEAYLGPDDPASHAFRGPRGRAWVMFEAGGRAYVYFSYGVHWCMNVVTAPAGTGGAALVRALEPVAGIDLMRRRRGREALADLASGPGKLAQALAIGPAENALDLVPRSRGARPALTILDGDAPAAIDATPRIGITRAAEWPLRFLERGSAFVSRPRTARPPAGALAPRGDEAERRGEREVRGARGEAAGP
jgi:DNA-3-methyladenine glycosylase